MRKKIVVSFGRFNPPHVGHAEVVETVGTLARKLGADACIFPSWSQGDSRNPLPFHEKLALLRQLFPRMNFASNANVRTPLDVLEELSRMGYDEVWVVVGGDQANDFRKFDKYIAHPRTKYDVVTVERPRKEGEVLPKFDQYVTKRPNKDKIFLRTYEVVTVPRNDAGWSATKMRSLAQAGDWETFRKGVPTTNDKLAKNEYNAVRSAMGLKEQKKYAFLYYGASPKDATVLREAFFTSDFGGLVRQYLSPSKCLCVEDISTDSFVSIARRHQILDEQGYTVRMYIRQEAARQAGLLSEASVRNLATIGALLKNFARDVVMVKAPSNADATYLVRAHATKMLGEEAETAEPKQPSEVDRLKVQQKSETLALKQRQQNDLLQAKKRELDNTAREDAEKIVSGDKPRDITK